MVQRTVGETARNDLLAARNEAYDKIERLERERDEARKQAADLRAQLAQRLEDYREVYEERYKAQAGALVAMRERDEARAETDRLMALLLGAELAAVTPSADGESARRRLSESVDAWRDGLDAWREKFADVVERVGVTFAARDEASPAFERGDPCPICGNPGPLHIRPRPE